MCTAQIAGFVLFHQTTTQASVSLCSPLRDSVSVCPPPSPPLLLCLFAFSYSDNDPVMGSSKSEVSICHGLSLSIDHPPVEGLASSADPPADGCQLESRVPSRVHEVMREETAGRLCVCTQSSVAQLLSNVNDSKHKNAAKRRRIPVRCFYTHN